LAPRSDLVGKGTKNVKCSISTCPSKAINAGCNFCINCTCIFDVGGSGNGLCSSDHCFSVHQLTENIDAIAAYQAAKASSGKSNTFDDFYG
jgi:hypothetical protein